MATTKKTNITKISTCCGFIALSNLDEDAAT
jgi:hypothetical protein